MSSTDGLGDWRISAASRLANDLPAAFPGGPSHKAGEKVYLTSLVVTEEGENIGFIIPSATAMCLNIAINANKEVEALYDLISYDSVLTPHGKGKSIPSERCDDLFNFFEQGMIVASFSFLAIEVFCNHAISRELKGPLEIERKKGVVKLSPAELERQLSTEEKLSEVIPIIKGVPTPKGKKVWEDFKRLKDARDSTIHLKSSDQATVDRESLFFQFLSGRTSGYPIAAANLIRYFLQGVEPRWLRMLKL